MRQIWTVGKDSYGDHIPYGATTTKEKAEQLAAAHNAEVEDTFLLYEDDDPVPEYVTLYTCEIREHPGTPATTRVTTWNVLVDHYSPDEEAHRPQKSGWAYNVKAENYLSAEEATAAARESMDLMRKLREPGGD